MASIEVLATLLDKLFKQFKNSPNIVALITIIADPLQDTVDVLDFINSTEGIDDSGGEGLDFIGGLIGVTRPLEQEPLNHLFTLFEAGYSGDESNLMGFGDEDDPIVGGYLAGEEGLELVDGDGQLMGDIGYRRLLHQKASAFRTVATRLNLFNYLLTFGSRCLIDDDDTMDIVFDPINYYDLSQWEKWYAINKGFKPAGISTSFRENMRDGDEI